MSEHEPSTVPASLPRPAVEELAARGDEPETSARPNRANWAHFERFCGANGYSSLPASEAVVLRYIYLYRTKNAWAWRTARNHVNTIRRIHVQHELPDPTRHRVELLLDAIRNEAGVPKDHIKPLRPPQAGAMADSLAAPTKKLSILRSAVAGQLARRTGASLSELAGIRPSDVRRVDSTLVITIADTEVALDADRDAELAENLSSLLPLVPAGGFLLAPGVAKYRCRGNLQDAMYRMTKRAGLPAETARQASPGANLTEDEFMWWIAWADPSLAQRVRDAAYILTALSCAYRHQNARVLLVPDLEEQDNGEFVARLRSNKTPSPTGSDENLVPAQHEDHAVSGTCDRVTCPACALRRWLRFRERAGITDPHVFCRLVGPPGPISAANAGGQLKLAAVRAGIDPKDLNTRSLRSGSATAMAIDGLGTPEIARVTHHHRYSVLAGYIRDLDPVQHRYHLPI